MSFESVIDEIYRSVKDELKKEKNMDILKNDIIRPIVSEAFDHIYPYLLGTILIIILLFLSIFCVLFLNVRLIIKDK
jgi:hypothetical protein